MKKFISGILMGAILATTVNVFAAGGRTIEVFDSIKKIVVNRVEKPMDAKNKPFAYKGTTYVPLRFIADNLGVPVKYDGPTGTIFLGETDDITLYYWDTDFPMIYYSNQRWASVKHANGIGGKYEIDNMGNQYSNYLKLYAGNSNNPSTNICFAEYALNGQFKTFKAKLGIPKGNRNDSGQRIARIYLDNKKVYEQLLQAGDLLSDLDIDLTGAMKIRFELQAKSATSIGFYDGVFMK